MKSATCQTDTFRSEPKRSDVTRAKSGQVMANTKSGATFPKSDFRHWESKIYKPVYLGRDGSECQSGLYTVRLAHAGRRARFALGLANLRESAKKASQIYHMLVAEGWEATLAKHKPAGPQAEEAPAHSVTVGEYIAAAGAVAEVSPRSLHDYGCMLRRIAAGVAGIKGDKKRYGPRKGGSVEWRERIDALPLAILDDAAVSAWKLRHAKAAGSDPAARRRAETTANSIIRQAKALFSRKIVARVRESLSLPDPLPFAGVSYFTRGSTRYLSKIDPETIMDAARRELGGDPARSEEWKIFLLALFVGLRRREIDTLTWKQFDFQKGVIHVEETEHFRPKSSDSTGEIDLDPETSALLQGFKKSATGAFVIESKGEARPNSAFVYYRAAAHFDALTAWLRAQGITARKPLHELRKEAGSLVARDHGLYAAQRFLRHASPATTAAHYLDKKTRVTPGLGRLLKAPAANIIALPAGRPMATPEAGHAPA